MLISMQTHSYIREREKKRSKIMDKLEAIREIMNVITDQEERFIQQWVDKEGLDVVYDFLIKQKDDKVTSLSEKYLNKR